jgi:hypothetical protein
VERRIRCALGRHTGWFARAALVTSRDADTHLIQPFCDKKASFGSRASSSAPDGGLSISAILRWCGGAICLAKGLGRVKTLGRSIAIEQVSR